MREKPGFFIVNKKSDFDAGFGGEASDDGVKIADGFFSGIFDSFVNGMRWYKLKSNYFLPENAALKITFYTSDKRVINVRGEEKDILEIIRSSDAFREKTECLRPLESFTAPIVREILLTRLKGRYLFFFAQNIFSAAEPPVIFDMKLYYAPYMWSNYLPEIYRGENGFLERYLVIFQSVFEDMEEKIERSCEIYSAENASYEFLKWLSGWVGINDPELWSERQLRYLVENAARIFSYIGTKSVVEELCRLYLEKPLRIIEYYDCGEEYDAACVPDGPYEFTVAVYADALTQAEYEGLAKVLDGCKPAHMRAKIVLISDSEPEKRYIGRDSALDGGTMI